MLSAQKENVRQVMKARAAAQEKLLKSADPEVKEQSCGRYNHILHLPIKQEKLLRFYQPSRHRSPVPVTGENS